MSWWGLQFVGMRVDNWSMSKTDTFGIHWFRRDLRLAGNLSLRRNLKDHQGRVLGIFCFDSQFLSRPDFSHNRFAFFLNSLVALQNELRELGGDLLVVDSLPQDFFPKLIHHLKKNSKMNLGRVSFNRDYEPFARERDAKVSELIAQAGIEVDTERDHLLLEPHEIFKSEPGDFYQVYSPFGRKWFDTYKTKTIRSRLEAQNPGLRYLSERAKSKSREKVFTFTWSEIFAGQKPWVDALNSFISQNNKSVTIPVPAAGSDVAFSALQIFKDKLVKYNDQRDFPSLAGTSRFSLFLKNGSLTSSQIISFLKLDNLEFSTKNGPTQFLKEIVWREFYYSILWHKPSVEKSAFLEKYQNINWENDKSLFTRWCEGTTGFPIVDAGMRELNTTGWMHNRVRMIVASFLCKDLLISWQWGENYFMKMLLDGDLAPNNGGWQWAASTGCDPQPYFRIFNPWLQSEKFDPQGEYIRKYVPELASAPVEVLHDPDADRSRWKYPAPVVTHSAQKNKALALYKV